MKIALGSDKSGFYLKEHIKKFLTDNQFTFDDLGTLDFDKGLPYYDTAKNVAVAVQQGTHDLGILVCGTGAGVAVVANKHKGIIAVPCESVYSARMSRVINDANILCMGGWIVAENMGIEMVKAFISTDFLAGLEDWRKDFLVKAKHKIAQVEEGLYGKQ